MILGSGLCVGAAAGRNFWAVDLGAHITNLEQRVTSAAADHEVVSHFSAMARLRRGWHLGRRFYFEPSLGLPLPWRNGDDGNVKNFSSLWGLNVLIPLGPVFRLRAGPSLEWMFCVSQSQTVVLRNGTSESEFYLPGGTRSVLVWVTALGIEILFSRKITGNIDFFVEDLASRERRRVQGAFTLGLVL